MNFGNRQRSDMKMWTGVKVGIPVSRIDVDGYRYWFNDSFSVVLLQVADPRVAGDWEEKSPFCEMMGAQQRSWLESTLSQSKVFSKTYLLLCKFSTYCHGAPLKTPPPPPLPPPDICARDLGCRFWVAGRVAIVHFQTVRFQMIAKIAILIK